MVWVLLITAAIVGAYLARWISKERETIRLYHDRIEEACDDVERGRAAE